ncbi:MAG: peptidoglycan DD-metalloendopeptidase family protein [Bacteroidales bacterium]|nr:peptidoglycan DD-metalloendopeptidase family protein [Candidatus Equimonas faecalis]
MQPAFQKILFLISFSCLSALNLSAQDLLARQAPTDRHLRAVDSIALRQLRVKEASRNVDVTATDLYDTWNTSGVHVYKGVTLPESYKIDLRGFVMPTPSRNITSRYGYRSSFRRNHYGLDVKVYTGDSIASAWDGKVRVVKYDAGGWGKYVVVRHANGLETLYAHLSKQLVRENQDVKAGEIIGLGGNTGRSTGSHLHLECRLLGEPINPELLFDFPNQDMTGDYYVWHRSAARSPRRSVAQNMAEKQAEAENVLMAANTESVSETNMAEAPVQTRYHKVKRGETAYSIARELGVNVSQLLKQNGLNNRSKLRPGQLLKY